MATYTKRVQTLLTSEQYERLLELSALQGKSVSALVREAVEQSYCRESGFQRRRRALDRLLALDAPVADWPQMEGEIEKGALDGR